MVPKIQTVSEFVGMKNKDQKKVLRFVVKEANKMQKELVTRTEKKQVAR